MFTVYCAFDQCSTREYFSRASKKAGGIARADLTSFPSNQFARVAKEKDLALVGKVRLPASTGKASEVKTVPLIVGPAELRLIHSTVMG